MYWNSKRKRIITRTVHGRVRAPRFVFAAPDPFRGAPADDPGPSRRWPAAAADIVPIRPIVALSPLPSPHVYFMYLRKAGAYKYILFSHYAARAWFRARHRRACGFPTGGAGEDIFFFFFSPRYPLLNQCFPKGRPDLLVYCCSDVIRFLYSIPRVWFRIIRYHHTSRIFLYLNSSRTPG